MNLCSAIRLRQSVTPKKNLFRLRTGTSSCFLTRYKAAFADEEKKKKYPYDTPAYRLSEDGKYYVVFNESTGKILKSVNYKPVKFDAMLPKKA